MLQSKYFIKTKKEASSDEVSVNAQFLTRGGFIDKEMAGVYSFLPLGLRVLRKIENIIREEINAIGGQELLMPALQPRELWEETQRWEEMDVLYRFQDQQKKWLALGPTHEEVLTDIIRKNINSYKDLPLYLFQIQTKFRDELRAKAGLLRGREFLMKDLYSFHESEEDRKNYYQKAIKAYKKIFKRCGLDVLVAEASGGAFSKEFSHEFQVQTPSGEDLVVFCPNGDFSKNKEITDLREGAKCPNCLAHLIDVKTIEVGNIFTLGTKFSEAMGANFLDKNGQKKPIVMGCYGIGISRIMGAVAEVNHDERGIIWPEEIAPFKTHLISITAKDKKTDQKVKNTTKKTYKELLDLDIEVLYDDRTEISAGAKFADSDLLGIPFRIVISEKTLAKNSVEIRKRGEEKAKLVKIKEIFRKLKI
ncbi:MAG: Prolyl-tRNA synthetase [Parcubacteria group bacterium GW2011_GWD2_38_12]|nr:MAG: Prolyl-tRNA synthetase [Parcubacteria group bacterium GW2011_GWC2_36_17]KKQ39023.1 MAG: Prolyl-tRNA synthetase [Candidatus Moranbacteria bacterium GW2011_GWF2_37_7]KKQ43905.1 MAG: Prolyl-tRNA synthetase [Parcubacteria group bacterium GW2011_GWE2_37_8]KKQ52834.1 MAG: Prolyl-tRNA synthetase [Parcubacteria group bacterium GW2011_GWD2_38_12]KKQ59038.1 MAG: Prolyl-tRNA synthetase [Parcubacteria group bacterium GW2011_GWC1_38_17]KKQ59653.1 MAG: Prolyl-tRNA synthetase [Parcubacteria group bac